MFKLSFTYCIFFLQLEGGGGADPVPHNISFIVNEFFFSNYYASVTDVPGLVSLDYNSLRQEREH